MRRFLVSTAVLGATVAYALARGPVFATSEQQVAAGVVVAAAPLAAAAPPPPAQPTGSVVLSNVLPGAGLRTTATPAFVAATPTPATRAVVAANPAPAAAPARFVDGTYTGPSYNAHFGNVQVQAVIRNGQLAAVNMLDYPSHTNRSQRINNIALPRLEQEVIVAQSANVASITGATLTVRAYRASLAAALDQAAR